MFSVTQHERMAAVFDRLQRSRFAGAVAICDSAEEAIVRTFGRISAGGSEVSASTLFDICSVTKTFTAATIRKLESEQRLSLEQQVGEFAHGLAPEVAGIRIHHLLTHSSGLADFLDLAGGEREYAIADDYAPLSREMFWEQIRRTRLLFSPGERWSYSNAGYTLLAAIVEKIEGERFEEVLRRAVLEPLGMHDTRYVFVPSEASPIACGYVGDWEWRPPTGGGDRASWNLIGNGGLLSSISDLVRWRANFDSMLTFDCEALDHRVLVEPAKEIWSGYGIFFHEVDSEPGPTAYHNGSNSVFSATVRWFPRRQRYLAIVSSNSDVSAMAVVRTITGCWKSP